MEKIEQKLDLYEFLLDFVSHEIRNPLNSIIMFSDLLTEGAYGDLTGEQKEILSRILASAYRIEHMSGDFLNLRRFDSQEEMLHKEWLHLKRNVIQETLTDLANKFPNLSSRISKVQEGDCSAGKIFADRQLLLTLYDNLFFNAIKYGREDGRIIWDCLDDGENWLMRVYNEGAGVDPKELDKIFEKFVRIKDRDIPHQPGTGLGLYNVRRIVELHGGKVWAESEPRKYFSIWLSLPRPSEMPEDGQPS